MTRRPQPPLSLLSRRRRRIALKQAPTAAAAAAAAVAALAALHQGSPTAVPSIPGGAPPASDDAHDDAHAAPTPLAAALAGCVACVGASRVCPAFASRAVPARSPARALSPAMEVAAFPFDTLKVRAQAGVPLLSGGLRSLFRGLGPSALVHGLHGAAYMPCYFLVKTASLGAGAAAPLAVALAASLSTLSTALVEVPVEALLLRVKSGSVGGVTLAGAARAAFSSRTSVAALFAGAAPFVARHVVYEVVEFVAYESLRAAKRRSLAAPTPASSTAGASSVPGCHTPPVDPHGSSSSHGSGGIHPGTAAAFALVAGAAATLASHPLDCLRVATSLGASSHPAGSTSVAAAAAQLWAKSGAAGFVVAGLAPRLCATLPAAVVFFTVWEATSTRLAAAGV